MPEFPKAPSLASLHGELEFSSSRAGGPGGQNVNKVSSKVTLRISIVNSQLLTADQKDVIAAKLSKYITKEGVLLLTAQESRSQLENKHTVKARLEGLLLRAFRRDKPRKATKPGKTAKRKRLESKKRQSEKKNSRRNAFDD